MATATRVARIRPDARSHLELWSCIEDGSEASAPLLSLYFFALSLTFTVLVNEVEGQSEAVRV
ncbi:MAG: hypothetical protein ABIZ50_07130, partial [Solirubrobacterales bacterium]